MHWISVSPANVYSLKEVAESDLHSYRNLAAFFSRQLKPGVRPLDSSNSAVLSPADGKVLQFGTIEHGEVEQVKGVNYKLDALLGTASPDQPGKPQKNILVPKQDGKQKSKEDLTKEDEEFAKLNGISYSLPNIFSGPANQDEEVKPVDASTTPTPSSEAAVRADLALGDGSRTSWLSSKPKTDTALYYLVVYLAPGDYHRFHSPVISP